MTDMENVIKALEYCKDNQHVNDCDKCDYGGKTGMFCIRLIDDTLAMLKERELPTELKQKMWNALYAEEDEYEKKYIGKEEHLDWFTVYRPWLQKGFNIAINVIADWEGR